MIRLLSVYHRVPSACDVAFVDKRRLPILERYLNHDLFELSRDSGNELALVTEEELMTLENESTLVMSVIAFRTITKEGIQCPLCRNFIEALLQGAERVYCQTCDKNVQVEREAGARDKYERDVGDSSEGGLADVCQVVIKTDFERAPSLNTRPDISPGDSEKPPYTSWSDGYLQELNMSTSQAKVLEVVPLLKASTTTSNHGPAVVVKVFRESHLRRGKVSPGIHKNVCALPTFRIPIDPIRKRLRREYEVWGRLYHPNIQRLEGILLTDLLPSASLVSDYKPLGDLNSFRKLNLPFDRFAMALGIADGLQYLHSEGVVHGDLTPMNILVEEGRDGNAYTPLITDFGKGRAYGHDGYTTNMTSSFFFARPPELLGHDDPDPATNKEVLSFASDVYSFSMVLLYLLTDIKPYSRESKGTIRLPAFILDEKQPLRPCPEKYPLLDESHAFCWPIMEACWKHVPAERISSREAYELLCRRSAPISL
ncbi:hypothetical protein NMY22_g18408 [Coprinellus aureogranulatus]|nr:hypothetical protein NMY22_g18408 [Coprinellus aureogranulatus]